LPDKKPVRITAIGSPSDQAVADQYAAFFKVSGYEILPGNYIGMTNMMPEKQITIGKAPDHYEITIAPSVFKFLMDGSLPIPAEIHDYPRFIASPEYHVNLIAIADPAMVFAP
jgi:hypothetical protein